VRARRRAAVLARAAAATVSGGTYLLQDPQSSLMWPTSLFVLLAGPSGGVRLMALFWGGLGCWAYVAWMRRHVAPAAALAGALGWVLSLGVAWRVAVARGSANP
jgi:hypothetical protein